MHVFELLAVGFAVMTVLSKPVPIEPPVDPTVWGDPAMRLYCLAGAVLGSIAKELAFTEEDSRRQQAAKLVAATIIATSLAPFLLHVLGYPYTPDSVVGAASALSFSCLAIVRVGGPVVLDSLPKLIQAWIKRFNP